MLTETTVSKLREMRLSVMANALKDQLADPQFQNMAFEDRLGLLVDAEWNARKNNHLNKLIRQATFSDPGACLENVEYLPDRGLKQEELLRFGTCNYIQEHHNIILLGATGSGKTYLACALGMAAARRFYAVKYIRLPDLLVEFQIARGNGTIRKLMAQYRKYGSKRTIITRPEQSYGRVPLAGLCRLFISVYIPGAGLPGARALAFPAPHEPGICPDRAAYSAPAIDTHKAQRRWPWPFPPANTQWHWIPLP